MSVSIIVPGAPVAKGRPRLTTRGGFARGYTPAKTRRYEDLVRLRAGEVMEGRQLLEGALSVSIAIGVPIPKGFQTKPKMAAINCGLLHPTTRPDLDNYIKCIDALNGIVFKDDAQIVELAAVKAYAEKPALCITVTPLMDAA